MATTTGLLTVEDFSKLAPPGEGRHELHHGELIQLPPIATALLRSKPPAAFLQRLLGPEWFAGIEFGFRPKPEYEVWIADVAIVKAETFLRAVRTVSWFDTTPDLVVEVVSPSNTVQELNDREQICLQNGARAFWIVDPKVRVVKVSTPDGKTTTYRAEDQIPLAEFGGGAIPVGAIFD